MSGKRIDKLQRLRLDELQRLSLDELQRLRMEILRQEATTSWRENELREVLELKREELDLQIRELKRQQRNRLLTFLVIVIVVGLYADKAYEELTLTSDERVARAEKQFQQEKAELEEAHRQEIKEAQNQVKLAEIESKRLALYNDSAKNEEHAQELEKAKAKLKTIKTQGVDYSALSKGKGAPSAPIDEQTKLILSGLWLGACFFLQRVFEKFFQDKGYALLTVCAAGFLLAFFTANYFLLGGSVTGGLMGSVGDRG